MNNNIIYTDSNRKDINGAILIATILLVVAGGLSFYYHVDNRLPYTMLGVWVIILFLFKRAEYKFEIRNNSIFKRWRFRSKTQIFTFNDISEIRDTYKKGFNGFSSVTFNYVKSQKLKRAVLLLSKNKKHHATLLSYLNNEPQLNLWFFKSDVNGNSNMTYEEIINELNS